MGVAAAPGLVRVAEPDFPQAGHQAPAFAAQVQFQAAHAKVVVHIRQAPLGFHGQMEVLHPVPAGQQPAAGGPQVQAEAGSADFQAAVGGLGIGIERAGLATPVVVPVVDQQAGGEAQGPAHRLGQAPGHVGGVGAVFHPDALFQADVADGVDPHRHAAFQAEGFDVDVAPGLDGAAGPAVDVEGVVALAVDQGGVGLGQHQAAAQGRVHRRHQQAVVAAGEGAGHGAGGVGAQAVGQPPFPALGLLQIAADVAAEADEIGQIRRHGRAPGGRPAGLRCAGPRHRW